MADEKAMVATEERPATTMSYERAPGNGATPGALALVTPEGTTRIADSVVARIAGIAAREVPGVHQLLPQGPAAGITGLAQKIAGGDTRALGVTVEVGQKEAAVDLRMEVDYGVNIPQLAIATRRSVMASVQSMTGLAVKEVNINVDSLYFPEEIPEHRVQ
jgi:uncharacterized alkaline shock family protein YloU